MLVIGFAYIKVKNITSFSQGGYNLVRNTDKVTVVVKQNGIK